MSRHALEGARTVEVPLSNYFRSRNGMELLPENENLRVLAAIAQSARTRPTVVPSSRKAPRALAATVDGEVAKTIAHVRDTLQREASAPNDAGSAAESLARAERAAIVREAAALSSGPPQENPEIVIAQEAAQYGALVSRLLGEVLGTTERVRHVCGLDYDEPLAQARHVRLDVALALENGVTVWPETMVARHRGARASHATDREQILALRTVFPECEALILREAANVERDYVDAFARVRAAAHRELVSATALKLHATDAVRSAADLAHSQDVARQARTLIDAATARGERLLAAEAVAAVEAQ